MGYTVHGVAKKSDMTEDTRIHYKELQSIGMYIVAQ